MVNLALRILLNPPPRYSAMPTPHRLPPQDQQLVDQCSANLALATQAPTGHPYSAEAQQPVNPLVDSRSVNPRPPLRPRRRHLLHQPRAVRSHSVAATTTIPVHQLLDRPRPRRSQCLVDLARPLPPLHHLYQDSALLLLPLHPPLEEVCSAPSLPSQLRRVEVEVEPQRRRLEVDCSVKNQLNRPLGVDCLETPLQELRRRRQLLQQAAVVECSHLATSRRHPWQLRRLLQLRLRPRRCSAIMLLEVREARLPLLPQRHQVECLGEGEVSLVRSRPRKRRMMVPNLNRYVGIAFSVKRSRSSCRSPLPQNHQRQADSHSDQQPHRRLRLQLQQLQQLQQPSHQSRAVSRSAI